MNLTCSISFCSQLSEITVSLAGLSEGFVIFLKKGKGKINLVKNFSVLGVHFALCVVILLLFQGFRGNANGNYNLNIL